MSRFNLIDESWIPVRFPDGNRAELGIRAVLQRAQEIAAIEDPSPLVTAAVHRFLLAVLYRALEGPTDIEQAKALFKRGLPVGKIDAYLEKWRDRFWLFDAKYPFGQIADFQPKQYRAWTVLAAEHNADNAKVLFDHVRIQEPGIISESAAARWLLAAQTFSVSSGKAELSHTKTAPSATAVHVIPLGVNLHDTLVFCLAPQNKFVMESDLPLWERAPDSIEVLKNSPERPIAGYADLYSWRSRTIRFVDSADLSGVSSVAFSSGMDFTPNDLPDPMLCYRVDEKLGRLPLQFRERGLWRDFDSLLPDSSDLAPKVLVNAVSLTMRTPSRFPRSMLVIGQVNDQAKIKYWRMERFTLPTALIEARDVRYETRTLLESAEAKQKFLWQACRSFARDTISRGEREPAGRDVAQFITQMAVLTRYWSILESRFHEMLDRYTGEEDFDEIYIHWLQTLIEAVREAWGQHQFNVTSGDAWTIRAFVNADVHVQRAVQKLNEEINELSPQKEEA